MRCARRFAYSTQLNGMGFHGAISHSEMQSMQPNTTSFGVAVVSFFKELRMVKRAIGGISMRHI